MGALYKISKVSCGDARDLLVCDDGRVSALCLTSNTTIRGAAYLSFFAEGTRVLRKTREQGLTLARRNRHGRDDR